jgi:hypothetical protein
MNDYNTLKCPNKTSSIDSRGTGRPFDLFVNVILSSRSPFLVSSTTKRVRLLVHLLCIQRNVVGIQGIKISSMPAKCLGDCRGYCPINNSIHGLMSGPISVVASRSGDNHFLTGCNGRFYQFENILVILDMRMES